MSTADSIVLASDMAALDALPKATQELAVTQSLEQANQWIDRANLGQATVYEVKDFNAFIATVTEAARQKELSAEIVLKARRTQNRAEEALGRAIRRGQEAGEIARAGENPGPQRDYERNGRTIRVDVDPSRSQTKVSAGEFFSNAQQRQEIYAMADADPEVVERAREEAEAEGNLSRANVVRKIQSLSTFREEQDAKWERIADLANQGYTSHQIAREMEMTEDGLRAGARKKGLHFPADKIVGRSRRIKSDEVLSNVVLSVETAAETLELVRVEDITPELAGELLQRLTSALGAINKWKKNKEINRVR